ncbi:LysR substrate-binding domain-containing protein [Escherichia coli]|uniref:LysR substrate-binding domain-containing protein n=1 Tax=Escherichia coli TaxID=562 RepID=UPI000BEA735B|nr:LysR substrate-binding domain-containing protein [Escherichia coli]ELN3757472.1 LysR family transcriptional regulator [Escherichia coli]MBB8865019.1 LysR family transcriptional regulator [Escherichia coli]
MESLNGMEVFVHVAQTRSFIATGRVKGISSSAVSKSISRLEERLGVRLFQRSTRSVRLTPEGEVFLERCRRIFGEIQAAEDELLAMTEQPRGRLRVGLPLAGGLMLPMISDFMLRYPEIELDLDFSDRLSDVIEEGMDVVIRGGDLNDSRLISRRLGSFRLCLAGAVNYFEQHGFPVRPDDLATHACMHYRYPSSGKLEQWPLKLTPSAVGGHALPSTMICSSLEALLFLVKEGRGIACLPDFSVKDELAAGKLQTVLDSHMTRVTTFHILWPSTRQMTPKVRVFVDFMTQVFNAFMVKTKK